MNMQIMTQQTTFDDYHTVTERKKSDAFIVIYEIIQIFRSNFCSSLKIVKSNEEYIIFNENSHLNTPSKCTNGDHTHILWLEFDVDLHQYDSTVILFAQIKINPSKIHLRNVRSPLNRTHTYIRITSVTLLFVCLYVSTSVLYI